MLHQIQAPQVFEQVRKNQIVTNTQHHVNSNPDERPVVVVSMIGSGPPTTHFKRAFRLALDSFGNTSLFKEKETEATKDVQEIFDILQQSAEVSEGGNGGEEENTGKDGEERNEEEGKVSGSKIRTKEQLPPGQESEAGRNKDEGNGNDRDLMDTCSIDGFYTSQDSILFLHLTGVDDPQHLLDAVEELHQIIDESGFLPVWSTLKSAYCRFLLLIFSLSHVVLFSDRFNTFNTNYLHLFRVLDAVRLLVKSSMSRALEKVGVLHKDWCHHARLCSPRLLFLFEVKMSSSIRKRNVKTLHFGVLDKKQGELEDEIYHIFRKCRLITNISANSLFAVPSEDEYIFLFDKSAQNAKYQEISQEEVYANMLSEVCNARKSKKKTSKSLQPAYRSTSGSSMKQSFRAQPMSFTYNDILHQFRKFILHHTQLALEKGFEDDSRRVAEYKHFFVVPTLGEWKIGFQVLSDVLLNPDVKSRTIKEGFEKLTKYINVDSEYLYNQCSNVYPKIYSVYQRGLPEFYSEQIHRIRLTHAMNAYLTISRGPGVLPWLKKLAEKCEQYWRRHQQCEMFSLFKHPCVNPQHRVAVEDSLEIYPVPQLNSDFPEMKHNAGARIISHCNCGRKQGYRDEPFTIREANVGFYLRMEKDCCDNLDRIAFPIFSPTATAQLSLEDMLQILKTKSDVEPCIIKDKDFEEKQSFASQLMEIDLRQEENGLGDEGSASQSQENRDEAVEEIKNDLNLCSIDSGNSKPVLIDSKIASKSEFKSKSEYLPGMMHSKSPVGLLPKFSSWALLRLGSSSMYNHSSGISPRSGFLSGSNFLLPWDVVVKAEKGVMKPVPRIIRGRRPSSRPKPIHDEFNVKIFFGFEYECQRGHRIIANDVEKVVTFSAGTGNAGLKESASKMVKLDMPLYFRCPCKESRDGRTMIAQLMRVHVVTPKAPVHCMLIPRVMPAPSPCPTFFPGISDPIKLTPSSYWVLRLPYCYVGDHQIFGPPSDKAWGRTYAKLLKDMFSVKSMTPAETKVWEKENL